MTATIINGWGWGLYLGSLFFLALMVALAFWPARVARRKGHSWVVFFVFSLFLFVPALIVAYMVPDRAGPGRAIVNGGPP